MNKLLLLLNTVKYLKFIQIFYRLYYVIRNKYRSIFKIKKIYYRSANEINFINNDVDWIQNNDSYHTNTFTFLNISKQFHNQIDWNYPDEGKLWIYNLNYFDFLLQKNISKEQGIQLINNYIENINDSKEGIEPYPLSLKCINWIKFLSKNKIVDENINSCLFSFKSISINRPQTSARVLSSLF